MPCMYIRPLTEDHQAAHHPSIQNCLTWHFCSVNTEESDSALRAFHQFPLLNAQPPFGLLHSSLFFLLIYTLLPLLTRNPQKVKANELMLHRLNLTRLASTLPTRRLIIPVLAPSARTTFHRIRIDKNTINRAYSDRRRSKMASFASSDADIVSSLQKLSIAQPEIVEHDAVKGGQEWKAALESKGKGEVQVTKTVSV